VWARIAVLVHEVLHSAINRERARSGDYMTLPASQYSVLDGAKVERLTDDTFRVHVAEFSFFNFQVEPVLTLTVQPTDVGCRIEMLACKLAGSPIVEAQNKKFAARMTNVGAENSAALNDKLHRLVMAIQ
jgi:hypothetical protein